MEAPADNFVDDSITYRGNKLNIVFLLILHFFASCSVFGSIPSIRVSIFLSQCAHGICITFCEVFMLQHSMSVLQHSWYKCGGCDSLFLCTIFWCG